MDKSKWIINSSRKIPDHVMNILSLGDKFGLPIDVNDKQDRMEIMLNMIENFEFSCYFFSCKFSANPLDKLRSVIVNLLSKHLYSSKYSNYLDYYILRELNRCKKFLKENEDLFITKADKGQITVIMDKQTYI